ncbi:hypothetical protein QUF90_05330, partial [Desulfococcaceae bacterium HSG9]|nr:hypothetical protein [Desulfococcaceae bacterium HSG9]
MERKKPLRLIFALLNFPSTDNITIVTCVARPNTPHVSTAKIFAQTTKSKFIAFRISPEIEYSCKCTLYDPSLFYHFKTSIIFIKKRTVGRYPIKPAEKSIKKREYT